MTPDTYWLGDFKNDQFQQHYHNSGVSVTVTPQLYRHHDSGGVSEDCVDVTSLGNPHASWDSTYIKCSTSASVYVIDAIAHTNYSPLRSGAVTRGKRIGINYIIKAL